MKKLKLRLGMLYRVLTKKNVILINYGLGKKMNHIICQTDYATVMDVKALNTAAKFLTENY